MKQENHLRIVQERILNLRSALFYDVSESVLRLPTTVIQTLDVDEAGQLWFVMPKPKQQVSEFARSFPVQMNYFKKNTLCTLQVIGKGYMVCDPEELSSWSLLHPHLPSIDPGSILMKVIILKAEIQDMEPEYTSVLEKTIHNFLAWCSMLGSGKITYEFQPA
jgi:hypothetical protein